MIIHLYGQPVHLLNMQHTLLSVLVSQWQKCRKSLERLPNAYSSWRAACPGLKNPQLLCLKCSTRGLTQRKGAAKACGHNVCLCSSSIRNLAAVGRNTRSAQFAVYMATTGLWTSHAWTAEKAHVYHIIYRRVVTCSVATRDGRPLGACRGRPRLL